MGLALVVGFLVGFVAQEGWAWRQSPARWHAVATLLLAVGVLGGVASLLPRPRWAAGMWSAFAAGLGMLLIRLPGADTVAMRAGLAVAILILTVLVIPFAQRRPVSISLGFTLVYATLAVLLGMSHFAKLAIITGNLAGICGLASLIALWGSRFAFGISGCLACGALIPTLALTGYAYDYDTFPMVCWVLVVGGTLGVWVGEYPALKRLPSWMYGSVSVGAVAILCAVAMALAVVRS